MKRLAVVLLAFTLAVVPASASNWVKVAEKVLASTFQLQTKAGEGFCTGFIIDDRNDYAMTASHCVNAGGWVEGGIYVDKKLVEVTYDNPALDAAVLKLTDDTRPRLKVNKDLLRVGTPVASAGYAYGMPQAFFRTGIIAVVERYYPDEFEMPDGPWIERDYSDIPGMSGGPVVDDSGKVIGVVQMGTRDGFGVSMSRWIGYIYQHTKQYWRA